MKKLHTFLPLVLLAGALSFSSCKKDPGEPNGEGQYGAMSLKVDVMNGSSLYALQDDVSNTADQHFFLKRLSFYISDISLIKSDGAQQPLSDLLLVEMMPDSKADPASVGTRFSFNNIATGNYTAIRFGLGVPRSLDGAAAPKYNSYPVSHPLSDYRGTVWTMDNTYRHIILEGKGYKYPASSPGDSLNFSYHLRTDTIYHVVKLDKQISINSSPDNQIVLKLDVAKLFNSRNQINILKENSSDMGAGNTAHIELGLKVRDNLVDALTVH